LIALRTIRRDSTFGPLITTIGIGVVLDAVVEQVWGSTPLTVPFFGSDRVVNIFGGRTQVVDIVLVLVAVLMPVVLAWWNRGTLAGLIMTTAAEDRDAASLRGINVQRTITGSMVATGALAGLLGPVIAPVTFADVTLGDNLAILAFVALAFGGFGATAGPLVGGFGVGLIESFTQRYLPSGAANLVVFGVLLCCLLVRPHGLLGKAEYARVL
jgi:branched-chain amino acid transport system permease protein